MNVDETTASPDVVSKALKDVMDLDFDATDSAEVSAAAVLIRKLSENAEVADELADSIARHSQSTFSGQASIANRYRNITLRTIRAKVIPDDPLQNDYPSESSAEMSVRRGAPATNRDYDTPAELKTWAEVHSIDKSYVTVSPEKLGFHPKSICVEWSTDVESKWGELLHIAEMKVSSPTRFLSLFRDRLNKKIRYSTEHAAKNYNVFKLEVGQNKSAAHFLFDPDTLYVLVILNDITTRRFEVSVDDTENLAKKLVNAFEGHQDYAKHALNSMCKAFAH
jgi:hypothetical protein